MTEWMNAYAARQAAEVKKTAKAILGKPYWQNANGTWSHHKDAMREWRDVEGCRTDLRFANEHEGQRP